MTLQHYRTIQSLPLILGNNRKSDAEYRYFNLLREKDEAMPAQIAIDPLVEMVAGVYQVSPREMTNAGRARYLAEARAMPALIGMVHCGHLLSDFAKFFNRDMSAMSKLVKAVRRRLETNRSMQEKMAQIQDQITTIRKA